MEAVILSPQVQVRTGMRRTNESGDERAATGIRTSSWRSFILQVSGLVLFFAGLLLGHAFWRTGSLALVWPYLAGQRLFFEPTDISLGALPRETQAVQRELRVINTGSKPLRVLGAQRSCACVALDEFPIAVPAGDEVHLRLQIGMPGKPMPFEHYLKFFSDESGCSAVVVTIRGSVP